jgi:hypothetical protein
MNKAALALTLISALLFSVVAVQLFSLVEGNFYPPFEYVEPLPGTVPPKITLSNPKNHTSCLVSEVSLIMSVSMPETSYPAEFEELGITCFLDGYGPATVTRINKTLNDLRGGTHKLEVRAEFVVHPSNSTFFYSTSTSTVYFTINNTLSSSTPTPQPTPEPESFPTSLIMASSVTVAVVVALGLLVYRIKRK